MLERKGDVPISVLHHVALGWPERSEYVPVKIVYARVNFARDIEKIISPRCENAPWTQDPVSFLRESVHVEPVQCLRNGNQIDGSIIKPAVILSGNAIAHFFARCRIGYLFLARVGRDDVFEVIR